MNTEKLNALAAQAGFDVERLRAPYPGGFPREDMLALESFAELIVRECVDTVSDCSVEYCTRPQIVSEIKQHFYGAEL
jgi:hypothetical protein